VNDALEKRMAARKMLTNASYFAFTATPKNKTLEMFGEPLPPDAEGKVKHRPFHSYTMKQAIEEGFILDVLKAYTPVDSYYKLVKKTEDDPEFDTKRRRRRSCAAMWRATTTRSGSRPRSWWTTSTSR
jgi:type I restriction enzyme R subunit